ncbi:MAG: SDR family NAD(P)-dependent oxidoreductase [Chloroflexi bacterium]|nr:SDR family NAD(P)-dependent oxidoreductase [Chloroflexota bacterium]
MPKQLEDKVAIVTGASRGIGAEIARLFAREGASVIVAARTMEEGQHFLPGTLKATVKEITAAGGNAIAVQMDLANEADCKRLVEEAHKNFGSVDVLVNNAAVNWYIPIKDFKVSHWRAMLAVDLTAPFLLAQFVIPEMIERKRGAIINISSGASRGPGAGPDYKTKPRGGTVYGTVKAGIERFTQGLAHELFEYNIAVNSLAPNKVVPTPGTLHHKLVDSMDDPRGEPPELMARAALLLATADPKKLTGRIAYSQDLLKEFGML